MHFGDKRSHTNKTPSAECEAITREITGLVKNIADTDSPKLTAMWNPATVSPNSAQGYSKLLPVVPTLWVSAWRMNWVTR